MSGIFLIHYSEGVDTRWFHFRKQNEIDYCSLYRNEDRISNWSPAESRPERTTFHVKAFEWSLKYHHDWVGPNLIRAERSEQESDRETELSYKDHVFGLVKKNQSVKSQS